MATSDDIDELELTDAELLTVLKNHGLNRRTLVKVLGVGAGAAALSGSAAAKRGRGRNRGGGNRIDPVYGATYAAGIDTVPPGHVDHDVELHVHPGDADHEGFPAPDGPDPDDQDDAPETFFDPVGLHVKPGDVVNFTTHGVGLHTVTAVHPKFSEPPYLVFPDRVATDHGFTSPPIAEHDSWLYRFTTKGVYDLLCLPHISIGMVMRIVVSAPGEDADGRLDEPVPDPAAPLPPLASAVLTDEALDPSHIVTEGEVAWADLSLP